MTHYGGTSSSRYSTTVPNVSNSAVTSNGYSAYNGSSNAVSSSMNGYSSGYSSNQYRYHPYTTGGSYSSSAAHSSSLPPSSGYGGGRYGKHGSSSGGYHSSSNGRFSSSTSSLYGRGGRGGRQRSGKAPRNEFGIPFGQPGAALSKIDWAREKLEPFQKNFYTEANAVSSMTPEEVEKWRGENVISVIGKDIPRPIRTFEEAGFPGYIMAEVRNQGFVKPTAIQSQGWPMAMSGRNVVGIAETGSGKTLAFLLPSIVHINAQPLLRSGDGPIVLVIAPTRELAMQIEGEVSKFAYSSKIKHCCVYGGVSRRDQARNLESGVEIVICTPGRLLDFLESGTTNLRRVTYLVIDEADRLLDMGFEPQLKSIFSQVRPDRQILMWSATWPKDVRSLAASFMGTDDTIQVAVGSWDTKANHDVTQKIEIITPYEKQMTLYRILREQWSKTSENGTNPKILIFVATKRSCDEIGRTLKRDGWPVSVIHGDKQQYERDSALSDFKSGRCPILLATDVASRGIHVDDISHVLNYDFPLNIEDYVHRIGRTGRCGKKGTAISFFTKEDGKRASKLIAVLEEAKQDIPKALRDLQQMYGSDMGRSRYSNSRYNRSNNSDSRYRSY